MKNGLYLMEFLRYQNGIAYGKENLDEFTSVIDAICRLCFKEASSIIFIKL